MYHFFPISELRKNPDNHIRFSKIIGLFSEIVSLKNLFV